MRAAGARVVGVRIVGAVTGVRWFGVLTSAAVPVFLIGGWTLAARLQAGGFDAVTDSISALAARGADHRGVMTAALVGTGLCHLGTALALRAAARPGRLVLALGGLATLGVAAFPLPAEGGSPAHAVTAGVAFVSLAGWPALARGRAGLVASVVLGALVAWFFAELLGGGDRVGLSERVAAGAQALWPLAAVLTALLTARLTATRRRS